jgi:Tetracyclin repressor-like, C-terminal domain
MFAARVDDATIAMLAGASDADFADVETVNLTLVTVIFGSVRNAFERNLTESTAEALHEDLILMCKSYVRAAQRATK